MNEYNFLNVNFNQFTLDLVLATIVLGSEEYSSELEL